MKKPEEKKKDRAWEKVKKSLLLARDIDEASWTTMLYVRLTVTELEYMRQESPEQLYELLKCKLEKVKHVVEDSVEERLSELKTLLLE